MENQEVIDKLRSLRNEAERNYKFAQSYGFKMAEKGKMEAYKEALYLMGAI